MLGTGLGVLGVLPLVAGGGVGLGAELLELFAAGGVFCEAGDGDAEDEVGMMGMGALAPDGRIKVVPGLGVTGMSTVTGSVSMIVWSGNAMERTTVVTLVVNCSFPALSLLSRGRRANKYF